jgi:DNA-binding Xre family transcriptional regulator
MSARTNSYTKELGKELSIKEYTITLLSPTTPLLVRGANAIATLCLLFDCDVGDLFEITNDETRSPAVAQRNPGNGNNE